MGMLESDYDTFEEILELLAECYSKKISEKLIKHYFTRLIKYHFDTVKYIIVYWDNNSMHKKFPTLAELIIAIKANSTLEYANKNEIDNEKESRFKKLDAEYGKALRIKDYDKMCELRDKFGEVI